MCSLYTHTHEVKKRGLFDEVFVKLKGHHCTYEVWKPLHLLKLFKLIFVSKLHHLSGI
jgi:hypothetical protein